MTTNPIHNIEDEELIFDESEQHVKRVTPKPMGIGVSKNPKFKAEVGVSQRIPNEATLPDRPLSILPIPRKKA